MPIRGIAAQLPFIHAHENITFYRLESALAGCTGESDRSVRLRCGVAAGVGAHESPSDTRNLDWVAILRRISCTAPASMSVLGLRSHGSRCVSGSKSYSRSAERGARPNEPSNLPVDSVPVPTDQKMGEHVSLRREV